MSISTHLDNFGKTPDIGEIEVRRINIGVSLLDCASQLPSTVKARVYDKVRRAAGSLRRVANDLSDYYGLTCDELEVSVTPLSVVAHSLQTHDLTSVAQALDAAAQDIDVDIVRGFATVGPVDAVPGFGSVAESIPSVIASTERIHASLDWGGTDVGMDLSTVLKYADAVRSIADLSAATTDQLLRVSCGPVCRDTLVYHPVAKPEISVSVEISCLKEVLLLLSHTTAGTSSSNLSHLVETIAFQRYRAAQFLRDRIVTAVSAQTGSTVRPGIALVTARLTGSVAERNENAHLLDLLDATSESSSIPGVISMALARGTRFGSHGETRSASNTVPLLEASSSHEGPTAVSLGDAARILAVPAGFSREEIAEALVSRTFAAGSGQIPHLSVVPIDAAPGARILVPGIGKIEVVGRASNGVRPTVLELEKVMAG